MIKVLSVFGTRPEAIKMCPLVKVLNRTEGIKSIVCVTAQHRQMLDQVLKVFDITPDYDLNLMKPKQTLTTISTSVLEGMEEVLQEAQPDIVLVHGDTTTSSMAALAAFYQGIPVGHVEAGLRTYDRWSPFPEELNRQITSRIAELHFAPTIRNRENLAQENITEQVYITGNTVIDAFATTVRSDYTFHHEPLKNVDFDKRRVLLMTAHRRENLGTPLVNICQAVLDIADAFKDVQIVYPVHLNPVVRETVYGILGAHPRITLTEPVDVEDMHNAIARSYLVLTDSGGLQEEAPSFGKPVVVLRRETERPEAVDAGTVVIAGINRDSIYGILQALLTDQSHYQAMARAINPYGDGKASERIVEIIHKWKPGKE